MQVGRSEIETTREITLKAQNLAIGEIKRVSL